MFDGQCISFHLSYLEIFLYFMSTALHANIAFSTLYSVYQTKGNPFSKVNWFEYLHVTYK